MAMGTPHVTYRPMEESDLPAAARILTESYRAQGVAAEFSAYTLRTVILPQYGIDLADCVAAEAEGEVAGVLLLAVDREARDSYVFGWNVRPALWRARIGLGLEKRYTEKHRELGLQTGWACIGSFRNVERYRAIGFRPVRTLSCFEAPPGAHPPPAGWEICPADLEAVAAAWPRLPAAPPHWPAQWRQVRHYAARPPWQMLLARSGGTTGATAVWRKELLVGEVGALTFNDRDASGALLGHLRRLAGISLRFRLVPVDDPLHGLLEESGFPRTAEYTEIRRDRF